jgi:hypothetical protein
MNVGFDGEFCAGFDTYSLRGILEISPADACQVPQVVTVGDLTAFGSVHPLGPSPTPTINPFPAGFNSSALISIIGTVGEIGAPCPSH